MPSQIALVHIFVDHGNMWGGARAASKIRAPNIDDARARLSVKNLDVALRAGRSGVSTRVVSGGVPPGMEPMWAEYSKAGYDTQRLFRDKDWREHGVDHTLIGHMWRLLALHQTSPTVLVIASGDGKKNEFGTSFSEVIREILTHTRYASWTVELASFDWDTSKTGVASPTNRKMRQLVERELRGKFVNLFDSYPRLVYHEKP